MPELTWLEWVGAATITLTSLIGASFTLQNLKIRFIVRKMRLAKVEGLVAEAIHRRDNPLSRQQDRAEKRKATKHQRQRG